ncbi:MAG: hypothetical protein MOB07_09605 [Acidobacteria bacterium]|nr:hypothetical protein [Acidobacteriota bacterium]
MKKFILILAVLWALTANIYATDVVISGSVQTNLPFNPTGIGNDRSISVSVSNGSPTVTSAGLFPANIIGRGGFQVLIDGTQYVVSGVANASTLTLTTNYSGTSGAQTMTLYKFVLFRVYADRAFQPLGETYVVQPGSPGSGNFFKEFAVSIINPGTGNVAYIPQFVLPATTDALITNQARYVFGFYRPDNSLLAFYMCGSVSQLALPTPSPTTLTAICQFNAPAAIVPPNNEAYPKSVIDARFPSCTAGQGG